VEQYRASSAASAQSGGTALTESQALEAIITDRLLEQEVRDRKIEVKSDDIDKYVDQVKARNHIDDYRFEAALTAQGMTLKRYREKIKADLQNRSS
jgi:peptidyl-prolyl cis-trans isomerase SurA